MTYGVKLRRSPPQSHGRHPDAVTSSSFKEWCLRESKNRPLALDLFSGAGGLGLGAEAAGWTVVTAVDHNERALATHDANFRGESLLMDLSQPSSADVLRTKLEGIPIDLIVGGPPCQPFSRAGMSKIRHLVQAGIRSHFDARRELWRTFVEVATTIRPRVLLLENVPDMALGDELGVVRLIDSLLNEAGYTVDYRLLDAWRHGVPQHRKRFIMQARRDGHQITWPVDAGDRASVRDAIFDLPRLGETQGSSEMAYAESPESELGKALRGNQRDVPLYDHVTRPVRADDREAFELMDSTTLYSDLPERLKRYRSDTFDDKYKRLGWDSLSRTITAHMAKDGYWYIHPEESRSLTVREAARLQTFPDSFRFSGTRSDAFRQIGNAVPPLLGQVVAQQLRPSSELPEDFTAPDAAAVRDRLSAWGEEARRERWWLFPGDKMTGDRAILVALLRLHVMATGRARAVADLVESRGDDLLHQLADLSSSPLSDSQKRRLAQMSAATTGAADELHLVPRLSSLEEKTVRLLSGENVLLQSSRVGMNVSVLRDLPREEFGLHGGLKVGLAQLVGVGPRAALRMSALRAMTSSEAYKLKA
ncbi:DNA cytosine methyltransferase [Frigoribacterium sp. SL97]|uniref:DNA cytosine methyltransferase n=1 Tax=Frigoribacterium sp. SL97 TaxID=2994664 RepID=UPI00226E63E4|nr:DNA cytosine methyltransferase [Frigoribacterium sp. SL97]WAC53124.1 DNA cytosine methyltransferase [Frigoribacterium sp. SL97]